MADGMKVAGVERRHDFAAREKLWRGINPMSASLARASVPGGDAGEQAVKRV
jgi:hypothetical protein